MTKEEKDYLVGQGFVPACIEYPFDIDTKDRVSYKYQLVLADAVQVPPSLLAEVPMNKQACLVGQSPNGRFVYTYNHDGMHYILSYTQGA
jgi:hypothetical protein